MTETMTKIWKLSDILRPAQTGGFAVGSFSPRYTKLIRPIVQAGMALRSPLIVQISEKEIYRHKVDIRAFAEEFYRVCRELEVDIPKMCIRDRRRARPVRPARYREMRNTAFGNDIGNSASCAGGQCENAALPACGLPAY